MATEVQCTALGPHRHYSDAELLAMSREGREQVLANEKFRRKYCS